MRKANEGGAPLNGGDETVGGKNLDQLIAAYIDRINTGEKLDPVEVLAENPEWGEEIVEGLERYISLGDQSSDTPLGTLGDYTLRRQIGRGGMGVVYQAWQNSMDREVALKVLPVGLAADEKTFTRFMREAKTAGKLDHPNVVAVHAAGFDENTPYYAMELVDGETLAQILVKIKDAEPETETPFGKKDDIRYFGELAAAFADVADGLQHAHSKSVVHRDIKPSNLILDRDGRLRILDFGLAHLEGQESLTVSGDVVGTPLYMSPEQARRTKIHVDHRTDVYSLGVTLYESLTSRPPFRGKNHEDTLSQIMARDPRPPRLLNQRVPKDLETIVLKCLRKDPADRYGTAEALAQDLRRFVRGDPVEARPESGWEKVIRWTRRETWKLAAAGALAILLVVVLWLAWEVYEANRPEYDVEVTRQLHTILRHRLWCSSPLGRRTGYFVPRLVYDSAAVESAVMALEDIGRAFPDRPDAWFWQARGLLLLEDVDRARGALVAALDADEGFAPAQVLLARLAGGASGAEVRVDDSAAWARVWVDAYTAQANQEWATAADLYGELITLRNENDGARLPLGLSVEIYLDCGVALTESGEYRRAAERFTAAAALLPGFREPELLTARAYWLDGEREQAADLLKDLYERGGGDDSIVRSILVVYDSLNAHREGLPWIEKLCRVVTRQRLYCSFYRYTGNTQEAIAAGEQAIKLDPADLDAYAALGLALAQGIRNAAHGPARDGLIATHRALSEELLERLKSMPGDARIRAHAEKMRARVLRFDGKLDRAFEAFERADAHDPGKGAKRWALAWSGRFEEAADAFRDAIRDRPHRGLPRGSLGRILGCLGKYEEQVDLYEQWFELDRERTVEPHFFLARSLIELARYGEAAEILREAIELDPRAAGRVRTLAFRAFWKDQGLVTESRRLFDVLDDVRRAQSPVDARVLTLLAFLRLHGATGGELTSDDFAEALAEATEAVGLTGRKDAEALAVLGEAQQATGDPAGALTTLEEVLRLPEATRRHAELLESFQTASRTQVAGILVDSDDASREWVETALRETGAVRINCGGEAYVDADGKSWEADRLFCGGGHVTRWFPTWTVDPLYHYQREFPEEAYCPGYRIPVPPATYRVTIEFAEYWVGGPGLRCFDTVIEDVAELRGYDIFERVGFDTVDRRAFEDIPVVDGALDIRFMATVNATINAPVIATITIEPDR